jgi:serine/threonine-protein kinase
MGVVYLAEDPLIGRQVAIKSIRFDPYSDDDEIHRLQQRFDQEIQIAGTFSHPNIVTLFDVGRESGRSFIAMEYVEGRNLRAELQANGPLSAARAINLVAPLCRALSYAHQRGVVHRDIKPTNILVSADGVPKITDFGVARLFGSTLTHAGKIFGTPAYMSPEQAAGGKLSGASDQFAIAAVMYELVTGERPFKGTSPTAVIYEVIDHHPPPPHEIAPLIPTAISSVIMRGLAKDPDDRHDTCDAFADALEEALAWSKANPELAYLDGHNEPTEPVAETTLHGWRAAVARLGERARGVKSGLAGWRIGAGGLKGVLAGWRIGARDLKGVLTGWRIGARARAAAEHMVEHPRSLAALAGGVLGVAALLTAVAWAASTGGPDNEPASLVRPDSSVFTAAEPAAGELPDRDRGVSRGSASHDLETTAPPAAAEGPAVEADEAEATTHAFVVSSRPAGARVSLNGEPLGGSSPLRIEVRGGERYMLRLAKDGYQPTTWAFSLDDLSPEHLESGELFFPLQPIATEENISAPAGTPLAVPVSPEGSAESRSDEETDIPVITGGPPPSPASIRRVRAPAEAPTPEKLRHVDPTLPAGVSVDGVVVLEIEVSARGNVVQARVLRGLSPAADTAALDAVVRWKYQPTVISGTPVHVLMTVTLPIQRPR